MYNPPIRNRLMTTMIYLLLVAIGAHKATAALTQALCSHSNTGSNTADVTDHYQSNGRCFDTCKANYAFAVVQDTSCWCSNYAPSDTVDVSSCGDACPGYGFEKCGSLANGLYGYVALNKQPSGTIGSSSSSSSIIPPSISTSSASSTPVTSSIQPVVSVQSVSSSSSTRSMTDLLQSLSPTLLPTSATDTVDYPTSPSVGSSFSSLTLTTTSMARLGSHFDSYLQTTASTPEPVTVEQTVTATPSVVISVVSITPSTTVTPQAATTDKVSSISSPTTSTTPTTLSTSSTSIVPVLPDSSSSSSSSSSSTTTTKPLLSTSSWTPTPVPSVMTVSGVITTITVMPSNPPLETILTQNSSDGGFMHNTGKVAGVFSLVGVAVAALIGLAIWAVYRRRRHSDSVPVGSVAGGDTPQRRPSRLSEMILAGGTTRSSMHGLQTAGLESGDHGETTADITPVTPRASYPTIVDQRLNPDDSLWEPLRRHNGSHASLHSLQDNRDYSRRMFRITNPDP
ncbi:MAG: hypothetical protein Q9195_004937 [Heterodermia aff. obscurata]